MKKTILAVLFSTLTIAPRAHAQPQQPRVGREAAAEYLRADAALYPRPVRAPARAKGKIKVAKTLASKRIAAKKPAPVKAVAKKPAPGKKKVAAKKPVKASPKQKVARKKLNVPRFSEKLARAEIPDDETRRPSSDGLRIKLKKSKSVR